MERLGPDVDRELGRFGPAAGIAAIVRVWPSAVGDVVARNAWPARLAGDGTLHVATTSAAWAFELSQLAPSVLAQLGETLGGDAPTAVRFAVGRVPEPATPAPPDAPVPPAIPDARERAAATAIAASIDNDELRGRIADAISASLARRRSRRTFW